MHFQEGNRLELLQHQLFEQYADSIPTRSEEVESAQRIRSITAGKNLPRLQLQ